MTEPPPDADVVRWTLGIIGVICYARVHRSRRRAGGGRVNAGSNIRRKGHPMHYKNGREARNGDKVLLIPSYGPPMVGILYDATAGNDTCNGRLAKIANNDPCPNLKECLHFDDVVKALPAEVPDSSQ